MLQSRWLKCGCSGLLLGNIKVYDLASSMNTSVGASSTDYLAVPGITSETLLQGRFESALDRWCRS